MAKTFLYVVCYRTNESPLKIGISQNIDSRIRTLSTGSAWEIDLLIAWKFSKKSEAALAERGIHDLFADWRMNGEWFDSSVPLKLISPNLKQFRSSYQVATVRKQETQSQLKKYNKEYLQLMRGE